MTQCSRPHSWFVLAHLSDPHLTGLESLRWPQLLSKRLSGYLSWQRRRRHVHTKDRLQLLVRDLWRQAPDHIAVTGDLTQLGTPAECREALQWLTELGSPDRVSVVPGNHDIYLPGPWTETAGLWRDYMANTAGADEFPFRIIKNPVEIIGLNSAIPTGLTQATGRLGGQQLDRLERTLEETGTRNRFRVLLIHHPPLFGAVSRRKRLMDAQRLRELLARRGAELILHGHAHRQQHDWLRVPAGRAPVVGVPSASAALDADLSGAAYNLIHIQRKGIGWEVQLERRRILADGSTLVSPWSYHTLNSDKAISDTRPS